MNQSISIQNKIIKPIELVLFSENETDINGEIRDPLEIFLRKFDEEEKEPYICRKISSNDGLIYFMNKKPSKIEELDVNHKVVRKLRMVICVTLFDESEIKLTETLGGIHDNLGAFCSHELSPEDIAVVVIADGILNLEKSMLDYFRRLDKEMEYPQLTIDSRLNDIQEEKEKYVEEGENEGEKIKRLAETKSSNYFPPSLAKKTAICYQIKFSSTDFPHTALYGTKYSNAKLNIFFTVKMANTGKLSSHLWFFQGFCKLFNPDYCTILDCGTVPHKFGIFKFFQTLEANKELGGVCGYLIGKENSIESTKTKQLPFKFEYDDEDSIRMKIIPILMNFVLKILNFYISLIENIFSLRKAQQFDYAWENIYNKSYQSAFGYVAVLPTAWSAYRWDALNEDSLLEKEYFFSVKNPDYVYKSVEEANIMLSTDRLLSLAIISKRNQQFYLKYCPEALAEVDLIETIPEFLTQRKRIINSNFYALDQIIFYNNKLRFSKHSSSSKLMFSFVTFMSKISLIIHYLLLSFYFVSIKIIMFSYFDQISLINNSKSSLAGFFLFYFIALMITLIFLSLEFKSIDKDMVFFFRIISHFLGIFMLFGFSILSILIFTEVFKKPAGFFINQIVIQSEVLIICASVLSVVISNPSAWKNLIFGFVHYLYYLPTYAHITVVYAFCRIDDLSCGVRGAHINDPPLQKKEFKDFKVKFVSTWLLINTFISYIMLIVISSDSYKGEFLIILLGLIAIITSVKATLSILYSTKYWIFDQNQQVEKTKELKPYYKKEKEEIETYYESLNFEVSESERLFTHYFEKIGAYENSMFLNASAKDTPLGKPTHFI